MGHLEDTVQPILQVLPFFIVRIFFTAFLAKIYFWSLAAGSSSAKVSPQTINIHTHMDFFFSLLFL
jgi:hypothetical protein